MRFSKVVTIIFLVVFIFLLFNSLINNVNKDEVVVFLDGWAGWKPIIDANGGLITQEGSLYDELNLSIKIFIVDNQNISLVSLLNNKSQVIGYSVNKYALSYDFLKGKVVMPYIVGKSNGYHEVISKKESDIKLINDLEEATIGVVVNSEEYTMLYLLLSKCGLENVNIIFFNSAQEVYNAYITNEVEVAVLKQPYLNKLHNNNIIFSTYNSNIILYGLLFNQEFYNYDQTKVEKIIKGALQAQEKYNNNYDYINDIFLFNDIMYSYIEIYDYYESLLSTKDISNIIFNDIRRIFKNDYNVNYNPINSDILENLHKDFHYKYNDILDITNDSLLSQRISLEFLINSIEFVDESDSNSKLHKFIEIANTFDNVNIKIEGNSSIDGNYDYNKNLSYKRAEAVANYFIENNINPSRLIIVGNGSDNPISDNTTQEGRQKNRRTDIYFIQD